MYVCMYYRVKRFRRKKSNSVWAFVSPGSGDFKNVFISL